MRPSDPISEWKKQAARILPDTSHKAGILDLLLELKEGKGFSLLFITHDIAVVAYVCDSIGVMKKGRIVKKGRTEKVLRYPVHEYTKAMIAAVPLMKI